MIGLFLFLFSIVQSQVPPTWVTSAYVKANSNKIIATLTGNSSTPTYTFVFSSPFPTLPNIAYGMDKYIGNFFFM